MKILVLALDGVVRDPQTQTLLPNIKNAIARYEDWVVIGIDNNPNQESLEDAVKKNHQTMELVGDLMQGIYFCCDTTGDKAAFVTYEPLKTNLFFITEKFVRIYSDENSWITGYDNGYGNFIKPGPGLINLATSYARQRNELEDVVFVGADEQDQISAIAAGVFFIGSNAIF
jgi:hypothetical protein